MNTVTPPPLFISMQRGQRNWHPGGVDCWGTVPVIVMPEHATAHRLDAASALLNALESLPDNFPSFSSWQSVPTMTLPSSDDRLRNTRSCQGFPGSMGCCPGVTEAVGSGGCTREVGNGIGDPPCPNAIRGHLLLPAVR